MLERRYLQGVAEEISENTEAGEVAGHLVEDEQEVEIHQEGAFQREGRVE